MGSDWKPLHGVMLADITLPYSCSPPGKQGRPLQGTACAEKLPFLRTDKIKSHRSQGSHGSHSQANAPLPEGTSSPQMSSPTRQLLQQLRAQPPVQIHQRLAVHWPRKRCPWRPGWLFPREAPGPGGGHGRGSSWGPSTPTLGREGGPQWEALPLLCPTCSFWTVFAQQLVYTCPTMLCGHSSRLKRDLHGEDPRASPASPALWVRHLGSGSSRWSPPAPANTVEQRQTDPSKPSPNYRFLIRMIIF